MLHLRPLLLISTVLTWSSAFAQTGDEIIVTATKIENHVQDLGLSISTINATTLSRTDGAEDIVVSVPGLQAAIANGSQIAFQIRGIGAVDHQALTPTATAVYIDGVYMATNVQTSPLLFDLERAEVLKGPQGALYGRNASAGAINFIAKGADTDQNYIRGEYGRFNRVGLNAGMTIPITKRVSSRLSGRYLSQDPSLENVQTNPAIPAPADAGGVRDEFGLRAITDIGLDDTNISIKLHYAEDNGINSAPRNSGIDVDDHQISIGPDGVQDTDNEFYGAAMTLKHAIGHYTLTSISAWEGYNQQYGFDFDGTPQPFGNPNLNANLAYDRDFSMLSQELRLNWQAGALDAMVGGYFEAEDFSQDYLIWCGDLNQTTLLGTCRYVGAPGRAGPTPVSNGTATSLRSLISQDRETIAAFTYNTYAISPKLDLVAGGRLSYEHIKGSGKGLHYFDDGTIGLNNRDGAGLAIGSNTIKDTRLSGNLGLNFKPSDKTLLYASFSNGYKSGGFNGEVINNATHFSNEGLFGSETVNALEFGFKHSYETFRYSASAFYQEYDQPQARIFVPFTLAGGGSFTSNSLSNLDRAVSKGIEGDISWNPLDGLNVNVGATWIDTKIQQDDNPSVPQNADTFDGNPLPFASGLSGTFAAEYRFPITNTAHAVLGVSSKYQSAFYLDAEGRNDRKQNGYEIIDAYGDIDLHERFSIGVWGKNLTNSDYATSGFGFIGYNTFRSAPMSYGARAEYKFKKFTKEKRRWII